jgi:hypothetical protein
MPIPAEDFKSFINFSLPACFLSFDPDSEILAFNFNVAASRVLPKKEISGVFQCLSIGLLRYPKVFALFAGSLCRCMINR